MKRYLERDLARWLNSPSRLPLIIKGARQVGKTYLIREFAKTHCPTVFEFNFEEEPALSSVFSGALDPETIINELSLRRGRPIGPKDLIFFDEIQSCQNCLTSLKYFAEKRPEQPIIAAGSLLGLTLSEGSFPVGKVEYLWLGPLTFEEFLLGINDNLGAEALASAVKRGTVSPSAHEHLYGQLKLFYTTGGLPKPILTYAETMSAGVLHSLSQVRKVQEGLVRDYQSDFAKHAGKVNASYIQAIFANIPQQLASHEDRSTGKYTFSPSESSTALPRGYQRLKMPIDWLVRAGLIYRIPIANQAKFPLATFCRDNFFKLYIFDVGILGALLRLPPEKILTDDYGQSKGYFAESLVLQALIRDDFHTPTSWQEGTAEIEFLLTQRGEIMPVVVKAGHRTQAKSLKSFITKYNPPLSVKLHSGMIGYDPRSRVYSLPLYLAWNLDQMQLLR